MKQQTLKRSFIYRKLDVLAGQIGELNGYNTLLFVSATELEMDQAKQLSLCDLSFLPRIAFKGQGTIEWLAENNVTVPDNPNLAIRNSAGCLIARLGLTEIMVMADINEQNEFVTSLNQSWYQHHANTKEPHGYILPRQDSHACFALTGKHVAEMFSKLCAVDLRPQKFINNMIAQTSVARMSCIIIRSDINETPNYYLLGDNALAEYLWECLIDAMDEFNGQIIGVKAIQELVSQK